MLNSIIKAGVLCAICSLAVSVAAVSLRGIQHANQKALKQRNILKAAGLYKEGKDAPPLSEQFKAIDTELIDLETGLPAKGVDAATYDQLKASKDPDLSVAIPPEEDIAGIKRREKYSFVYYVNKRGDKFDKLILPIYGKGLWSTIYGYLALESDLKTVAGITFYKDGETPGLGGEINNPNWQATWHGKQAFEDGKPAIDVVKGGVKKGSPEAIHQIDALSGATITSNGVENTIKYWLGDGGFGPFLSRHKPAPEKGKD